MYLLSVYSYLIWCSFQILYKIVCSNFVYLWKMLEWNSFRNFVACMVPVPVCCYWVLSQLSAVGLSLHFRICRTFQETWLEWGSIWKLLLGCNTVAFNRKLFFSPLSCATFTIHCLRNQPFRNLRQGICTYLGDGVGLHLHRRLRLLSIVTNRNLFILALFETVKSTLYTCS